MGTKSTIGAQPEDYWGEGNVPTHERPNGISVALFASLAAIPWLVLAFIAGWPL